MVDEKTQELRRDSSSSSSSVASKAKPGAKVLAPKHVKLESPPFDGQTPSVAPDQAIRPPPQLPLDELASCHFISNYVLIPQQCLATTRGYLEFVLPLLKTKSPSPHFKYAFQACSLASLNNRVGTGNDFDKAALGCYTKALASTFRALKDPEMMKRDDTLAAILLLGFFENITAKTLGMLAWSSHIEGAIQLVKARGPGQLDTKVGLDLFTTVRTQMVSFNPLTITAVLADSLIFQIIHSLSTGKAPTMGVDWFQHDTVDRDYVTDLLEIGSLVGEMRNEVNALLVSITRSPDNVKLMQETIEDCKSLNKKINDWLTNLPESCQYKTVAWEPYNPRCDYSKAEIFPGRIDMYGDLWIANSWNVMRCMQIVLASLIIRCTAWVNFPADYRTTSEYAATARTCVVAMSDIIASVPFQMGVFSQRKDLKQYVGTSVFGCGEDDSEKGLAGYFLLWPLTCIQGQDYLTDSQRLWVKGRLKSIGNKLGVRYGNMLSEVSLTSFRSIWSLVNVVVLFPPRMNTNSSLQLNVRMPSMLILRDRLKNNPQNVPIDIAAMLAGKAQASSISAAPPIPVTPSLPVATGPNAGPGAFQMPIPPGLGADQRDVMHMKILQRQTEELVRKAVESTGKVDDWTVKTWLQL